MKKKSKAIKRRPRHICQRCSDNRPPQYHVRVVGGKKDTRFCCTDGYRDQLFSPKLMDNVAE